uniref:Uncharacterized protein n=1 Tax=Rhizophora mucronata TaxID=61149 RepID=A0A2P2IY90_RHIMU
MLKTPYTELPSKAEYINKRNIYNI